VEVEIGKLHRVAELTPARASVKLVPVYVGSGIRR
jgi:hypothetical protein